MVSHLTLEYFGTQRSSWLARTTRCPGLMAAEQREIIAPSLLYAERYDRTSPRYSHLSKGRDSRSLCSDPALQTEAILPFFIDLFLREKRLSSCKPQLFSLRLCTVINFTLSSWVFCSVSELCCGHSWEDWQLS